MNDLSDLTIAAADRLFIERRARELADQMEIWNTPGCYPTHEDTQRWMGHAAAILRMVGGRANA